MVLDDGVRRKSFEMLYDMMLVPDSFFIYIFNGARGIYEQKKYVIK
jgi:hypothetical protein